MKFHVNITILYNEKNLCQCTAAGDLWKVYFKAFYENYIYETPFSFHIKNEKTGLNTTKQSIYTLK